MSKSLSLKVKDEIFSETETLRKTVNKSRNKYINDAIDFFNKMQRRSLLKIKLGRESKLVSQESLEILDEFERFAEGCKE